MAPRRHRSVSNINHSQKPPPPPQRTYTPAAQSQRQMGMLPAVYQSNMKVLLRREPSITSIIDQFSHVCLYHHNGQKWEKHGYEGSMFLFEKSNYPTYGFYILNRMGTDDYVRPIYPEDDMGIIGDYLMCRFYPDFTQTRLEMGLPYPIPEESRPAFIQELSRRIPPEEQEKVQEKEKGGRSTTLGLWMFATDAREPLKEVMMRLHSYVKQNLPYPEEYRYGPGRPPPPNPHLRTESRASVHPTPEQGDTIHALQAALNTNGSLVAPGGPISGSIAPNGASSGTELDKLFAKLITPSSSGSLPPIPTSAPPKTVGDLFASLTAGVAPSQIAPQSHAAPPDPHMQTNQHNSLNQYMPLGQHATPSQAPPPTVPPIINPPPSRGLALLDSIFASAAPSASAVTPSAPPPHSFTSQPEEIVIVSPKPTSSALPQILNQDVISSLLGLSPGSRASSAAPSSTGSRSAHQRYDGDNELSEGDQTSEGETSRLSTSRTTVNNASRDIPALAVPGHLPSESNGPRRIQGDVTPRPAPGGIRLPPTSPPHSQRRSATPHVNPSTNGLAASSPAPSAAARARTLVPFEANSDLWPYPRAPLDDRSFEQDDVVELDFNDTRALSDPAIFSSRLKEKKQKKEKRKGRKEREREKETEKAEIEKGWDLPAQAQAQPAYEPFATGPVASAARGQSPAAAITVKSPTQAKKVTANGNGANGHVEGALDNAVAKEAILSALMGKTGLPARPQFARSEFVRELLTLIHTDSSFVEGLWQDYLARTA